MTVGEKMIWAVAFNDALKDPPAGPVDGKPRIDPIRAACRACDAVRAFRFAAIEAPAGGASKAFEPGPQVRDLLAMLRAMEEL